MSLFDYMPHRMLINRSLRKAADELREHIDEYQSEYDRRVAECDLEIETAEERLAKEREMTLTMLSKELDEAESELNLLYDNLASYVDLFLYLECLRKIREIRKNQIDIYNEDAAYLGSQMRLIGEEIEILEVRKAELTSLANIEDIVNLANMTPPGLDLESGASCKELLDRITTMLGEIPDDRVSEKRSALKRLKVIVQERSEYADSVKYIDWIIRQKKQFSAQLSAKRRGVYTSRTDAKSLLHILEQEIDESNRKLNRLAEAVRMHWVRPIVYLSAEINYSIQKKRDIGRKLHDIASRHEYDPDWDDMESKRKRLETNIGDLKSDRQSWYRRRSIVLGICRRNNAPLRSDGDRGKRDQRKLISARLDEIRQIRVIGNAEAEAKCEEERLGISQERDERLQALEKQLDAIEEEIRELKTVEARLRKDISKAAQDLKTSQERQHRDHAKAVQNLKSARASDTRFILFRVFTDSAEVARAKSALRAVNSSTEVTRAELTLKDARPRLHALTAKITSAEDKRERKKTEIADTASDYEKRLSRCRPRYLRPTMDERLEEEKLQLLVRELEEGMQGGTRR